VDLSVQGDRWPALANACRLLERVSELQYAPIVSVPTHDLDTDWQPVRREPSRYGYSRLEGNGDPVGGFLPRDVVLHCYTFDLLRPIELCIEWWELIHGRDQEFVPLVELAHAIQELAMLNHGGANIRAAQLSASFDFPYCLGLQLIPVLLE
jgi:hypothetical protein